MIQRMLVPRECEACGSPYYESNYDGDGRWCLPCSLGMRRREEEEKKALAEEAKKIAAEYGLDLGRYADELPEEARRLLNPKNAGRKAVKYRPEYGELLVKMAAEGKTESEFAARVGISQPLLSYWTEKHPRFRQARETAAEQYRSWLEDFFRNAMAAKVPCVPSLLLRMAAAKLGWADKYEQAVKVAGGEIPVVKIVERDAAFPSEKLEPTAEQLAEAGLDRGAV